MRSAYDLFSDLRVAAVQDPSCDYPEEPPFNPQGGYPEYPLSMINPRGNSTYELVRKSFAELGLDQKDFGSPRWNPLGEVVGPGESVVIKPNFVLSDHHEGGDLFSIITHASVIRAVVDYVYIALHGKGRIIIADTPQMDCNFQELLERTRLESIRELYRKERNFEIEILDLRSFWLDTEKGWYSKNRHKLSGDPAGEVVFDLGKESLFYGVTNYDRFYGADFNRDETIAYHHGETHRYVLSKTILSADVVISVPKLKTHKKVGVTLNLKGLVGTVVNKNCLVHYTLGSPSEGGDQFPDGMLNAREKAFVGLQRLAFDKLLSRKNRLSDVTYRIGRFIMKHSLSPLGFRLPQEKQILDAGNWYGNDSAWRMAVDLYRILLYADKEGRLRREPVRKAFSVVDGIVGGECNGPLTPKAKRSGTVITGSNLGAVDLVSATLMGFDVGKIKMLKQVVDDYDSFRLLAAKIEVLGNLGSVDLVLSTDKSRYLDFEPHPGWAGRIEVA